MDGLRHVLQRRQRWRRCQGLLRDVRVPDPFDVDAFCDDLSQSRGRPIHVLPQPGAVTDGTPCGVWIATAAEDVIFVEPGVAPLHREHIILHEVGHMICDHEPASPVARGLTGRLMPHLSPALVTRVLGRTSYATAQEQEAEMVATMIGSRITQRTSEYPVEPEQSDDVVAVLGRLSRVLGSPER